jgi:hypothetical protein
MGCHTHWWVRARVCDVAPSRWNVQSSPNTSFPYLKATGNKSLMYLSWSTVLLSRITNSVSPFEHAPNQTITLWSKFRFCFRPLLLSASGRLTVHIRSFWVFYIPSNSNIFSSETKNFNVCSSLKFIRIQLATAFILLFWTSAIEGSILFLQDLTSSRSYMRIL